MDSIMCWDVDYLGREHCRAARPGEEIFRLRWADGTRQAWETYDAFLKFWWAERADRLDPVEVESMVAP